MSRLEWKWYVDTMRPIPSPRGEAHDPELDAYFTVHPVSDGHKLWVVYVKTQGMFEDLTRRRRARGKDGAVKLCEEYRQARVAKIAAANGYVKLEPGQCVVQAQDLKVLQGWASYGNWNPEDNEDGPAFERIRAASTRAGANNGRQQNYIHTGWNADDWIRANP